MTHKRRRIQRSPVYTYADPISGVTVSVYGYIAPRDTGWTRVSHAEARAGYTYLPREGMRPVKKFPLEPEDQRKFRAAQRWRSILRDQLAAAHNGFT